MHARRHHPRARTGARAGGGRDARAGDAGRRDHRRQPVRAGRQGHLHRRRGAGVRAVSRPAVGTTDRLAARFAACAARGPRRARHLRHRRRSRPRPDAADPRCAGCRRGRHHRDRHAVHRSDGRRPGDPGGQHPQPGVRDDAAPRCSRRSRAFRVTDAATPLILMGYFNPDPRLRPRALRRRCRRGGPRRDDRRRPAARGGRRTGAAAPRPRPPHDPPRDADDRRARACRRWSAGASGFVYYVAVAGITGAGSATTSDIAAAVGRIKAATPLPVAVGFGVRTPAQAAAIAAHADAVVVGSAIVERIGAAAAARANDLPEQVEAFVRSLADAVRAARRDGTGDRGMSWLTRIRPRLTAMLSAARDARQPVAQVRQVRHDAVHQGLRGDPRRLPALRPPRADRPGDALRPGFRRRRTSASTCRRCPRTRSSSATRSATSTA